MLILELKFESSFQSIMFLQLTPLYKIGVLNSPELTSKSFSYGCLFLCCFASSCSYGNAFLNDSMMCVV